MSDTLEDKFRKAFEPDEYIDSIGKEELCDEISRLQGELERCKELNNGYQSIIEALFVAHENAKFCAELRQKYNLLQETPNES